MGCCHGREEHREREVFECRRVVRRDDWGSSGYGGSSYGNYGRGNYGGYGRSSYGNYGRSGYGNYGGGNYGRNRSHCCGGY